jgi:uncharacterized protein
MLVPVAPSTTPSLQPSTKGRGLASHLVRFALDEARATGRIVLPFCPFVRSFIQRHPAYVDLVGQPERFDLTLHTLDAW